MTEEHGDVLDLGTHGADPVNYSECGGRRPRAAREPGPRQSTLWERCGRRNGGEQATGDQIRDLKRVATCLEFGPRPNTGVFLQITRDGAVDFGSNEAEVHIWCGQGGPGPRRLPGSGRARPPRAVRAPRFRCRWGRFLKRSRPRISNRDHVIGAIGDKLLHSRHHLSGSQPRSGNDLDTVCPVARIFTELPPTSITNTRLAADARDVAPFAILAHLGFKGAKVFISLAHRIRGRVRPPVAPVSCRTALHHHKWHGFFMACPMLVKPHLVRLPSC